VCLCVCVRVCVPRDQPKGSGREGGREEGRKGVGGEQEWGRRAGGRERARVTEGHKKERETENKRVTVCRRDVAHCESDYIYIYVYLQSVTQCVKKMSHIERVTIHHMSIFFFLMGTAALYRVCSTGLR